jgi:sulfhydrogenase subunit beta (sulfur reductase)
VINVLNAREMEDLFSRLRKDYETFGAVEENGEVVFDKISRFSEVSEKKSRYAPKEFLISRNENVLSTPDTTRKAVFGIKSCDLKGFYIMDKQILGKDPFYTAKRNNTLFVNFVCTEQCAGGFCSTFGGPLLEEYQIQVVRDGENYYVLSSDEFSKYLDGFKEADLSRVDEMMSKFKEMSPPLNVEGIENRIKWNSILWKNFASECISCGACNYSCPTCYCFDLYDRDDERLREWDSCILGGFTSTSAGNVRNSLDERLRQRFYHKFVYYKKSRGEYLCTGCNRCVDDCPVEIDIKEVITHDYQSE